MDKIFINQRLPPMNDISFIQTRSV